MTSGAGSSCATSSSPALLGDGLLAERGLALSEHDVRAVGEALSAQLDAADTVVTLDPAPPQASSLLEHVLPPEVRRVSGLHRLDVPALLAGDHDVEALGARTGPLPEARALPRGA